MTILNIDRMFQPRGVAVVGASERAASLGSSLMRNLIDGGYQGAVYPVNPQYREIFGLPCFSSVKEIEKPVDLVVIAVPIRRVPDIVRESSSIGAGGAIVISAGGKEIGSTGAAIEETIRRAAAENHLRIVGPNCLGLVCSPSHLNATFAACMPNPGKVAFISQSGAICSSVLDFSLKAHIGFSYFVSLGSMLDVDFADMIDYVGADPSVSSIVLYIENLTHIRNFMSAARRVSRVKPIIALKAGRSQAGAKAAASHTGALASEDAVYDAAFKRAGIVRVKTFEELFDCSAFLAKQPTPRGGRLAIVTNAGGPGVMAVDALSDYHAEPAVLEQETIEALDRLLPPYWSRGNPVDILGDASPQRYQEVVEVLSKARGVDGLLIMLAPQAMASPTHVARVLADYFKGKRFPVFTAWMGGAQVEEGRRIFNQAGVSTFDTPERAVRAFMDLYRYSRNIEMLQEIPASLPGRLSFHRSAARAIISGAFKANNQQLTEAASKKLLASYGIPVNPVEKAEDARQAVAAAETLGYPVALKVYSADVLHKTDAGGVILNVENGEDVRQGYSRIMENMKKYRPEAVIQGVTVQPMLERPDYELILGAKRDREFGPVLLFGTGGIYTEIFRDRALALPPLNRLLARRMMEETRIYQVLKGYRGRPAADLTAIEEILIRLSQLLTDFSQISEIDINPLIITGQSAIAADARVIIEWESNHAPHHLVISPYPNQYESHLDLPDVGCLFIRPIRPEDAPLLSELFDHLSAQSVYYRFFSPMKTMPRSMLARFTQIDYDREIAMVGIQEGPEGERMLGVARVIMEWNQRDAEFAVLVGDQWQGKGIGAALLTRCLSIAAKHHIENVQGIVLPENTNMLALGRKLGFAIKRRQDLGAYELSLSLVQYKPEETESAGALA